MMTSISIEFRKKKKGDAKNERATIPLPAQSLPSSLEELCEQILVRETHLLNQRRRVQELGDLSEDLGWRSEDNEAGVEEGVGPRGVGGRLDGLGKGFGMGEGSIGTEFGDAWWRRIREQDERERKRGDCIGSGSTWVKEGDDMHRVNLPVRRVDVHLGRVAGAGMVGSNPVGRELEIHERVHRLEQHHVAIEQDDSLETKDEGGDQLRCLVL
jgi:hypothetical protein